ncbi:MAG: diacylglycerol kinase family protein [Patescibacteria group bacterium]
MYHYIYDSFLSDKRYENEISQIEARILALGINGRVDKLTILKNLKEIVEDGIKKGAETLVVMGDDMTLGKVISYVAPFRKIILGYIPLGQKQSIARLLGIPNGVAACDVLSKRMIKKFDLGKANEKYFLFSLEVTKNNVVIECDDHYNFKTVTPSSLLRICNLGRLEEGAFFNPGDGLLEAVVVNQNSGWNIFKKSYKKDSVFTIKKAKIKCDTECVPLLLDGQTVVKTPASVEIVPKRLNIIVGKERKI